LVSVLPQEPIFCVVELDSFWPVFSAVRYYRFSSIPVYKGLVSVILQCFNRFVLVPFRPVLVVEVEDTIFRP